MKLAILSREPRSYSTRRLIRAANDHGHKPKIYDTLKFSIEMSEGKPDLYYRGKRFPEVDAVIPRIGSSITYYGTAVVRQFEQMGTFSLNSALAITNSRDKLKSMQVLSKHDIGIPPTTFVKDRSDVMPAIERVGGAPVIIKVLEGTQGVGVILADSLRVAAAIVETLQSAKQNVLIQKFVAESRGRDIRALVVGDQVVAAMRRVAQGDDFRSNVHQGGRVEKVTLSAEYERTAVRAAQILGLRVAGVDMLEGDSGPQVMEVNSSPGLEGIESATRIDVAGAIIDHIDRHILFPELDLRQRLTAWKGYGVAEIVVGKQSDLPGKTIAKSGILEQDIAVLELKTAKGLVVPNPNSSRVFNVGDKLLCFGRLEAMRAFTAPRKRRRPSKLQHSKIAAAQSPSVEEAASIPPAKQT